MYFIRSDYKHRSKIKYFDDTGLKDQWQKEVYLYAKNLACEKGYRKIVDFGCGSGYKLINYFNDFDTIGIDLEPTVKFLSNKYPNKKWMTNYELIDDIDIFIASDVIEHMLNPDVLLDYILDCKPKEIILSTPDRDLVEKNLGISAFGKCRRHLRSLRNLVAKNLGGSAFGPPANKYHVREWTFFEFQEYIKSYFKIVNHYVTNEDQCTQMVHAKLSI